MADGTDRHEDAELEAYLRGDSDLSRAYRATSRQEPPPRVDEAVLAAARAARARPERSRRSRWLRPVTIAALVVLSVTVILNVQRESGRLQLNGALPVDERDMSLRETAPATERATVPLEAMPETPERQSESTGKPAPGGDADDLGAGAGMEGEMPRRSPDATGGAPGTAARITAPREDATPALPAAAPRALLRERGEVAAQAASRQPPSVPLMEEKVLKRETADTAMEADGPAAELARIAGLWQAGKRDEALAALRTLLEANPGYRVADLEAALPAELVYQAMGSPRP